MRGFGNSQHLLAVGSFGDDMIDSSTRTVNTRANTLVADGIRLPITHRPLKADALVDFGTSNRGQEIEGSTTRGDSPYWPNGGGGN